MNAAHLPDTQNSKDTRQIIIDKVGIKDIAHPITYIDRDGNKMPTIGRFTMTVSLPEHVKGTHMSRFIEILNDGPCEFNSSNFDKIINKVCEKLKSDTAHFLFLGRKKPRLLVLNQ